MKKIMVVIVLTMCLFSCENSKSLKHRSISKVEIETIFEDSLLSIRAIDILNDGSLAFAANNGEFGLYNVAKNSWTTSRQIVDSLKLEFRSVAHTSNNFFMLSVSSPALLYKTGDDGQMRLVYFEDHAKAFYDSMIFWNDKEGIAIGDPTENCLSIIITRDGGDSWNKIPCESLPKIISGEAAFAASNTNIVVKNNHTWIATGGKVSRVLYSPDNGVSWQVFKTPIVQGLETTGIFSIDFYDEYYGFAIGGDYTRPKENSANKIKTTDGGKTWQLVSSNKNPGYSSCVQFVPNRNGQELVSVGASGIDFSKDFGETWQQLSTENYHSIRFLNDSIAYASGNGKIAKLKFK